MSTYIKSVNFAVKDSLLTGNPSKIVQGTELDTEFNNIATAISSKADIASPTFTGTPSAPTPTTGDNSTRLATTAWVTSNSIPSGGIIIWSGSQAGIPSGWLLCNGTSGTPNLMDKFIVGAGSTYAVGNSGGRTDTILPSHTHTVTDPGHAHGYDRAGALQVQSGSATLCLTNPAATHPNTDTSTTGISVGTSGVDPTNTNLPPYYALCYIMKA